MDDLEETLRSLGGTPAQLEPILAFGRLAERPLAERVGAAYAAAGDPLTVAKAVSVSAGLKFFQPSKFVLPPCVFKVVPPQLALRHSFLPVKFHEQRLFVAASLPLEDEVRQAIVAEGLRQGEWSQVLEVISAPRDIEEALETYYGESLSEHFRGRRQGSEAKLLQRIARGGDPGPPSSPFPTPSRGDLRRAHWDLAYICSRSGRQEEGLAHLETAFAHSSDLNEEAACLLAMGQLYEQLELYERALEPYREALRRETSDRDGWYLVHNNLGYALNRLGRYEEAEGYCRSATRIDPRRYNAHKNLGISYEGLERYAEAARAYICATDLCPLEPRSLTHLLNLLEAKREEVRAGFPEIEEELHRCKDAAAAARRARWD